MSDESLPSRIRRATAWLTLGYGASQFIRFGGNLLMARLLMPEAFGLMAIAWAVMAGLAMVSDAGLRQCIVQSKRGDDPLFLDTVWVVQVLRGALLTFLALLLAGGFALGRTYHLFSLETVYGHPELPAILAVVALTALISGFEPTNFATANRKLALSRVIAIDLVSQLISLFVMAIWALQISSSVWALAVGGIAASFFRVTAGYLALPGHSNRWRFDSDSAKEILKFGKWIFLSSMLGFAAINGDKIVLGAVFNSELLGQYALGAMMVGAMQQILTKTISNVVLPALSETVRQRPADLKKAYYRLRVPIDTITLFLMGFFYAIAIYIVGFLYDDRYLLAGQAFQILIVLLLETRYESAIQCYLALGKSKYISPIQAVRLLPLFLVTPWVGETYGLLAACWVVVSSSLLAIPVHLYFLRRCNLLDGKRELLVLPFGLIGIGCGLLLLEVL